MNEPIDHATYLVPEPIEFDCVDCGSHIFAWGTERSEAGRANGARQEARERCATCQWMHTMDLDEEERAKLKAFLALDPEERPASLA